MSWGAYESPTIRALRSIDSQKYNADFVQNLQALNHATDFMADYIIVMQHGVDDANKDVIAKFQDFIEDLIIIFSGGSPSESGFEFGDLIYILQALGSLFGLGDPDGPIDLAESVTHFFNTFLSDVTDFGDFIQDKIDDFIEFLIGLLDGIPIIGDLAEQLAAFINNATSTANDAVDTANDASSIIVAVNSAVQVVIDGLPIRPYWEAMNLTEEATFPRFFAQVPALAPPANTMEGGFIRCLYDGGRGTITYIPDAVTSPCELYVILSRMLSNGDLEILYVSANQTPLISNSRFERTVELPTDIPFSTGESLVAWVHQKGSGNTRKLLGYDVAQADRAVTVFPPQGKVRFASSSTMTVGTVIAAGTLDFTSPVIPYIAVGMKLITGDPIKLIFYNNFDTPPLPSVFVKTSVQPAEAGGGRFRVSGLTDGLRRYIYAQPLHYDDQMVSGQIRSPSLLRVCRLVLRSDSANNNYVCATFFSYKVDIDRVTGSGETFSSLASLSVTIADGEEYRFKAVGYVFTLQKKISGVWTDTALTYNDSGHVTGMGEAYRYVGLGTERGFGSTNGGDWDYWRAEDI